MVIYNKQYIDQEISDKLQRLNVEALLKKLDQKKLSQKNYDSILNGIRELIEAQVKYRIKIKNYTFNPLDTELETKELKDIHCQLTKEGNALIDDFVNIISDEEDAYELLRSPKNIALFNQAIKLSANILQDPEHVEPDIIETTIKLTKELSKKQSNRMFWKKLAVGLTSLLIAAAVLFIVIQLGGLPLLVALPLLLAKTTVIGVAEGTIAFAAMSVGLDLGLLIGAGTIGGIAGRALGRNLFGIYNKQQKQEKAEKEFLASEKARRGGGSIQKASKLTKKLEHELSLQAKKTKTRAFFFGKDEAQKENNHESSNPDQPALKRK